MRRRDSDVLMDSNLAFSARQLKYEAGSRRLCAFYGENRPIGSSVTLAQPLSGPRAVPPPVVFLSLRKDRVIAASVLNGIAPI